MRILLVFHRFVYFPFFAENIIMQLFVIIQSEGWLTVMADRLNSISTCSFFQRSAPRVPNFEQKLFHGRRNKSERTMFRRNSACFVKQKTYGIPFRVIPQNRKNTGILLRIFPRLEHFEKDDLEKFSTLLSYSVEIYFFVSFRFVSFRFLTRNRPIRVTRNSAKLPLYFA